MPQRPHQDHTLRIHSGDSSKADEGNLPLTRPAAVDGLTTPKDLQDCKEASLEIDLALLTQYVKALSEYERCLTLGEFGKNQLPTQESERKALIAADAIMHPFERARIRKLIKLYPNWNEAWQELFAAVRRVLPVD